METFSVNLWITLSRIIGTEEQVLIRRRIEELSSKCISNSLFNNVRSISSGSRAEGLSFEGSDFDYMFVRNNIPVSMLGASSEQDNKIFMETDNIKPGFVRLYCRPNMMIDKSLVSSLVENENGFFLSSLFFRDNVVNVVKKRHSDAFPHGPCASIVESELFPREYDLMECLACNSWPSLEWRYRSRHQSWPPNALVKDIIDEGCLLVPIGNPSSQNNFIEWRISFSLAEKKLVHSFNHTQLLCYALLKLFLKHAINSNDEVKDLLCSYFLKTSLFYCIEEENISWCKENMFHCFWTCFRRILKWVQQGYCPNYFIKENNMTEGKISGSRQRILLQYLSELYAEGPDSLRRIPCLSVLFGHEHLRVTPIVIGRHEKELICDTELMGASFANYQACESKEGYIKELAILGNVFKDAVLNIDKAILYIWYNTVLSMMGQCLYRDTLRSMPNKTRYKKMKYLNRFIINIGDDCTRILLLATLSYLNGKYQDAVSIIQKVLQVHGKFLTMIDNDRVYMDEICGKGYKLQRKMKLGLFSSTFRCKPDCGFYPQEIKTELFRRAYIGLTTVPTLVYFNVLLVLSYYNLNMKQNMNCALNELNVAVQDASDIPIANDLFKKCEEIVKQDQLDFN